MKTNKIYLFVLLVLTILAPIARAEDTPPARPAPGANADSKGPDGRTNLRQQMEKLFADIKVTRDQREKLKPILKERNQKMTELRKDTALSKEEIATKRKAIFEASDAKIKGVLNPDQFEKFLKFEKDQVKRLQKARRQQPIPSADSAPKN